MHRGDRCTEGADDERYDVRDVQDQLERYLELGVHELAGLSADAFRGAAPADAGGTALVVVHPSLVPAAALAPLLIRDGKPGFVVEDMTDLAEFADIPQLAVPDGRLYLVDDPQRGDELRNWTPDEALPELTGSGRTPLTISEGISWLLQEPHQLEPNHCFMCIGSRKRKPKTGKLDARTPALWISGGTGRDGTARRNAAKVGWCWAGNRHTWLGFASAAGRR